MTQETNQTQERRKVMDGIAKDDLYKPAHYRELLDAYHNHPAVEPILFRFLLNFDERYDNDSDGATVVAQLIGALLRHQDTPKRLRRKIAKEMRRLQWKADTFNTADPEHVEQGADAIDHANRKREQPVEARTSPDEPQMPTDPDDKEAWERYGKQLGASPATGDFRLVPGDEYHFRDATDRPIARLDYSADGTTRAVELKVWNEQEQPISHLVSAYTTDGRPDAILAAERGEGTQADSEAEQAEAPLTDEQIEQITEAAAFLMSQPLPAKMRRLLDDALLECANDRGMTASDPDMIRGWVPKFLRTQAEANN